MYVHFFLKTISEDDFPQPQDEQQTSLGLLSSLKKYALAHQKPFYYKIGQFQFNLDEIKHGLLRQNQRAPNCYTRSISNNDDRL